MARRSGRQNSKPYRRVWDPVQRKMVRLHRLLAARHLGRPLRPEEVVHHRDGDSLNNALENLEVLPDQRHHVHVEYHQRRWRGGQLPLLPEGLSSAGFHNVTAKRRTSG